MSVMRRALHSSADANRCSGKVRNELSGNHKSYRYKTHFKFNLKPKYRY